MARENRLGGSISWLHELLSQFAREVDARALEIHFDADPQGAPARSIALDAALTSLFRFVLNLAPDGCEIYLACGPSLLPVSRLGSGTITMRWQVAGDGPRSMNAGATAIRPIPGSGSDHLKSSSALALDSAFAAAGWTLELGATDEDCELWARATRV